VLLLPVMQTDEIVGLLVAERDRLNRAIEALQGSTARRGRTPRSTAGPTPAVTKGPKRKRRGMNAAQRKAQSARMKAFWAARKKQKAKA
jgi:hypothetical protein